MKIREWNENIEETTHTHTTHNIFFKITIDHMNVTEDLNRDYIEHICSSNEIHISVDFGDIVFSCFRR